jgi:hypothetical protein
MDEGGYWERRDVSDLRQKIEFLGRAIDMLAGALEHDRLSPEAREDPEILATRIERLARQVGAILARPAEHAPVHFPDDETGAPPDPTENETRWDALFAANRRKQERMERVMEEQIAGGADTCEALEAALEDAVPMMDWEDDDDDEETAAWIAEMNEACRATVEEPWQESLPEAVRSDADEKDAFERMERHPLQQQATTLLMEFFDIAKRSGDRSPNLDTLIRNAMEVTGGLAQVLPPSQPYEMDDGEAGLALVQLKRALRGAAFVHGTLFLLRAEKLVEDEECRRFIREADSISEQITDLLRMIRGSET